MFLLDGHLDLAYNAVRGREILRPAREQITDEEGIPTVGLPDLHAGGVGLAIATIFCESGKSSSVGYTTADEAAAAGRRQLDWYHRHEEGGYFRIVRSKAELPSSGMPAIYGNVPLTSPSPALPIVLLLEGADPIRDAAEVGWWHQQGLRAVGLAWKQTRYAGGTLAPGPLTPAGIELARALDKSGIIHDTSHLAEESFWQLLEITTGPVMATHSNCRAIVPTDRQLSDAMIRAVAARGGVIGINFYQKFLLPPDEFERRRATLADVVRHCKHLCDLLGHARQVALGTDMDGGLGRDEIPVEIQTSADLPRVADALSAGGFGDQDVHGIMGKNWLRFLREAIPG